MTTDVLLIGLFVLAVILLLALAGGLAFVLLKVKADVNRIIDPLEGRLKETSQEVLERQGEKAQESLGSIITPLKENLEKAQEKMDTNLRETEAKNAATQARFEQISLTINNLKEETDNLAKALSGEKAKKIGDWGEMKLESALEMAGLQKDENFLTQQTYKPSDGPSLKADFVLKLPDAKAIVIDSKVSTASYLEYTKAEDEETRKKSIAGLQAAVMTQVDETAKYHHFKLDEHEMLDIVLMFMPVEGAWQLLLRNDDKAKVFEKAFAKGVLIVGQVNLLATLSTIMHIWRGHKLDQSTEEIRELAAKMVDALELAVQRFGKLESQSKSGIEELGKSLTGKQGALPYAEKLRDLGVKGKKD